ncbi:MAG: hypothetical protein ACE5KT_04435 [Methanosarcinales archaeon]
MQTYTRQLLVLQSENGAIVRDINRKEYIDCVAWNGIKECLQRYGE